MMKKIPFSQLRGIRLNSGTTTTVDTDEINHFKQFSAQWWDPLGPLKPLHSLNKLRVPLIRDGLLDTTPRDTTQAKDSPTPLQGFSILDVGCGGGILSEPLARIGGNVTGLDANADIIPKAQAHGGTKYPNLRYLSGAIEDHAKENVCKYDAVVASEILEHVTNKEDFIGACLECLKPGGSIFITTMNKTAIADFAGIFLAENVLRLLPEGTHDYEKFIEVHRLQKMLEDCCCKTVLVHGMFYNPFSNTWSWCSDNRINYALHGIRLKSGSD